MGMPRRRRWDADGHRDRRGFDANDGGVRTASATATFGSIAHTAEVIATDPFADGSPFAFVAPPRRAGVRRPEPYRDGRRPPAARRTPRPSRSRCRSRATRPGNTMGNAASPYRVHRLHGVPDRQLHERLRAGRRGRARAPHVRLVRGRGVARPRRRQVSGDPRLRLPEPRLEPRRSTFSYVDLSQLLGGNTRGFSAAFALRRTPLPRLPGQRREPPVRPRAPRAAAGRAGPRCRRREPTRIDLNLHDAYDGAARAFASVVDGGRDRGARRPPLLLQRRGLPRLDEPSARDEGRLPPVLPRARERRTTGRAPSSRRASTTSSRATAPGRRRSRGTGGCTPSANTYDRARSSGVRPGRRRRIRSRARRGLEPRSRRTRRRSGRGSGKPDVDRRLDAARHADAPLRRARRPGRSASTCSARAPRCRACRTSRAGTAAQRGPRAARGSAATASAHRRSSRASSTRRSSLPRTGASTCS